MASTKIALDRYVYEDIYPAFKAATDEKEKTARINQAFLNFLTARNVVLTGCEPLMSGYRLWAVRHPDQVFDRRSVRRRL